jgi:non-canonical purine NTP pyrophosphatase (RdgB/HAM1 family)
MKQKTTLNFITSNENKLREAREILKGLIIESESVEIDEIQTLDPIVCVEKKAEAAFRILNETVLVEDTSLSIGALSGLPGTFVDYFMKTLGNEGILKLLKGKRNRKALAQTSVCVYDGKSKFTAVGITEGLIANKEIGNNGFGWDTIFIPTGSKKTFAQMSASEKNSHSMRRLAFEGLLKKL